MATVAFDALKFIEHLEKAGYSEHQARETAKAYQAAHEGLELATRRDITESEHRLEYKIELLRSETRQSIAELKNQLIMWLGGMLTVSVSVIVWFIEHGKL